MSNESISALLDLARTHVANLWRAAQGDDSKAGASAIILEAEKWEKAIAQAVHEDSDTR